MARMHSRKRGKSGSTKPTEHTKLSWMRYKPKEIEMLIVKLAREEHTTTSIGTILRDAYGIPNAKTLLGKSISDVLREKKLVKKIPEDLTALIKKGIMIRKHIEENKHDMAAKRGLQLTESKIKRLVRYYKETKRLPVEWKYEPKKSSLILE